MKKLYAFLFAAGLAATAFAAGEPDLNGYWDFTGKVNTGGAWDEAKVTAESTSLIFEASSENGVDYVFTYVTDDQYFFKGTVQNADGSWWLYVNQDSRGEQDGGRYLRVECGPINSTNGQVTGYYNFRFSINDADDPTQIGEQVQYPPIAMPGYPYTDILSGFNATFAWNTYSTNGYTSTTRETEFAFALETCMKTNGPSSSTVVITDENVESTDFSATVTASLTKEDIPDEATIAVEYAVVTDADSAEEADYSPMDYNDDTEQYEATISFSDLDPGQYFVMVKATATNDEEEIASAAPVQAGEFTVTETIKIGEVTMTESPEENPVETTIIVSGIATAGLVGADITVSYQLNEEEYVEMTYNDEDETYEATVSYIELAAGSYDVNIKAEATKDDDTVANDEREEALNFTVIAAIEIGEATVTESPEDSPVEATITVSGITGPGLVGADITVSYQLNDEEYVEMTYNEDDDTYEATVLYETLAIGTYNVTVLAKATIDDEQIAAKEESAGSFTVDKNSAISGISGELNGEVRYFNLQGVEVSNPSNGVFVKVANGKSTKVVVK